MINQISLALDSPVGDLANLHTVEALPAFAIELFKKLGYKNWVNKIYEGVAYIAFVFEIDWKVKKVILVLVILIDLLEQHFLCVLVWNVFDHDSRSTIFVIDDIY